MRTSHFLVCDVDLWPSASLRTEVTLTRTRTRTRTRTLTRTLTLTRGAATGTCGVGASAGSCLAGQLMTCDCAQLARAEADAATSLDGPAAAGGIATCDTCGSCWCKY